MVVTRRTFAISLVALIALGTISAQAQERFITVASTTSTEQSGLFGHLLPRFEQKTGIKVHVVAVGTGQALDLARRGDADVVFVHARAAEEKFLAEGHGVALPVMYSDFVLGPKTDPADQGSRDILEAQEGGSCKAPFVSRGERAHASNRARSVEGGRRRHRQDWGPWYRDTGKAWTGAQHRGLDECVHPDRSRYLVSFKNRGDLTILVEGDKRLFNQYGVMLVNPDKHPTVKKELGQMFVDWVISPEGQKAIADYKINGEQLFYPNAGKLGA
jgi:tungstate transport system substrate-binding protein